MKKKIKIIDLLNKIANGEDEGLKIFTNNFFRQITSKLTYFEFKQSLNDEIEIIEEKKMLEKLEIINEKNCKNNWKWKVKGEEYYYNISTPQKIIADKINQVIDYLKSKGE